MKKTVRFISGFLILAVLSIVNPTCIWASCSQMYCDVAVIGGGAGGVGAAIEAARHGKHVILFEKGVSLGGLATNGYVPQIAGNVEGICLEFARRMDELGYLKHQDKEDGEYHSPVFDPEMGKMVLEEMVQRAGARIMYDCTCYKAVTVSLVYDLESKAIAEGRLVRHVCNPVSGFFRVILPGCRMDDADFVTFSFHSYFCRNTDPEDISRQILEQHRLMRDFQTFLRCDVPGFERVKLIGTGSQPGVRDSRRIFGEYMLTSEDAAKIVGQDRR